MGYLPPGISTHAHILCTVPGQNDPALSSPVVASGVVVVVVVEAGCGGGAEAGVGEGGGVAPWWWPGHQNGDRHRNLDPEIKTIAGTV